MKSEYLISKLEISHRQPTVPFRIFMLRIYFYYLLHTAHPVVQSVVPSKAPR